MDKVKQIANFEAKTLNMLRHWGRYSSFDTSYDPRTSYNQSMEKEWMMCDAVKKVLATVRALETNRDLETALVEVKMEVAVELAKILAETIDPVLAGTESVKIEDDNVVACGICLEDMEKGEEARAMGVCGHKFHDQCIFQWVKMKHNCPLCRCALEPKKYTF